MYEIVLGKVTRLLVARGQEDLARVKDLVDHGVDPNSRDKAGFTALMEAAMHGREEVATYLLGLFDINIEVRDEDREDSSAPRRRGGPACRW